MPAPATGPAIVLAHLATAPLTPEGYSAHLELHVRLRTFPYIGLTVHGTSTYLKATWKRRDGGTIELTQTYAPVGTSEVVAQQRATIDIPHMRAELTATYSDVTLDTPMFAIVNER